MTEYEIPNEIVEIGCMCDKCNCAMKVFLVTSICDSCLKNKHIHKIINKKLSHI